MTGFEDYITPELLVIIPVLYAFGMAFKSAQTVKDKHIPILIGVMGVILACIYVFATQGVSMESSFMAITQGILCASASVYSSQLYIQSKKDE